MTHEEYKAQLNEAIKDPTTAPEKVLTILDALSIDLTERDKHAADLTAANERIKGLETTNQNLFLRVTAPENPQNNEPDKAAADKSFTDIMSGYGFGKKDK